MACVAEHHAPARSRTGVRQPPAWSVQDDTVVPFAPRQRGRGSHRGCALGGRMHGDCHPAAGTRGERGGDPHRGHPRLPGVKADAQAAIMHLRVRTLRHVERTEHGLECSHYDLPSAPRGSTIALLGVASHPHVLCHRVPPRGTSCPSRRCAHPAVAGAWVCARGVVRHGHDTTSGIDARAVAPVRPQGRHGWPCRRRPHAADGPQEGARNH